MLPMIFMKVDVQISPKIWKVFSHYFFKEISPFSFSSPSRTPGMHRLFFLMISHGLCGLSLFFLSSFLPSFLLSFLLWLDNFKEPVFYLTDRSLLLLDSVWCWCTRLHFFFDFSLYSCFFFKISTSLLNSSVYSHIVFLISLNHLCVF